MGQNKGYLTAARDEQSNEQYTPFYAVEPITKYIPKDKKIWCPFDAEWSAFYQTFVGGGLGHDAQQHRRRAGLLRICAGRLRRDCQQSTIHEERRSIAQTLRTGKAVCNIAAAEFTARRITV